jgi:histidine triad (HIT) family protein
MDCIFCKIAEGSIPSRKVFENDRILAFHDIQPAAPVHILIIPKKHIPSLNEMGDKDWELIGEIAKTARLLAKEHGVEDSGYRLVNNCGKDGGQEVFHLHFHLMGGAKLGPLFSR